jgi:23S rRNA (uracil1939-C5)-methyltransferase
MVESRSGYGRAKVNAVITPSPDRAIPECPYFGQCGGCQYQHIGYAAQLRYKVEILRETLRRTAKLDLGVEIHTHSLQPWHYRNRTRMQVRHTPEFAVGYFRANSHELLPVEYCPISSSVINQGIAAVRDLGCAGEISDAVHGLQFFADHNDEAMLLELYVQPNADKRQISHTAHVLMKRLSAIRGVILFTALPVEGESEQLASSVHGEPFCAVGEDHLHYRALGHDYRVSGGSFFQTNSYLIDDLVAVATAGAAGQTAFDLYAGVGLFSVPLAAKFKVVIAVEASPQAVADLRQNAPSNVKTVRAATEAFLQKQSGQFKPDFILLDPPRAGLGERATRALCRTSALHVTYVSCDPATLSRDLRLLLESGFKVHGAHLFDLFPQTAHMETVLKLAR